MLMYVKLQSAKQMCLLILIVNLEMASSSSNILERAAAVLIPTLVMFIKQMTFYTKELNLALN